MGGLRNHALTHTRQLSFLFVVYFCDKVLEETKFLLFVFEIRSHIVSSHRSQTHYELSLSLKSQSFGLGLPNARVTDVRYDTQLGESSERKKNLIPAHHFRVCICGQLASPQ